MMLFSWKDSFFDNPELSFFAQLPVPIALDHLMTDITMFSKKSFYFSATIEYSVMQTVLSIVKLFGCIVYLIDNEEDIFYA